MKSLGNSPKVLLGGDSCDQNEESRVAIYFLEQITEQQSLSLLSELSTSRLHLLGLSSKAIPFNKKLIMEDKLAKNSAVGEPFVELSVFG